MIPSPHEREQFELELRALPGVLACGWDETSCVLTCQNEVAAHAATELARRRVGDEPSIAVVLPGTANDGLRIVDLVGAVPGVVDCRVDHGPRGEVTRLRVTVEAFSAAEQVRALVARLVGECFATRRLHVDVSFLVTLDET